MIEPGQATANGPGPAAQAAAALVAPDAITAELLAKHSAGTKLTASEYGKLGAAKKKGFLSGLFGRGSDAPGQPAPARPGQPAGVATMAPAQAPDHSLDIVALDAALAQRTTSAILKRLDAISVRWISGHAVKAGAVGKTLDDFRSAASLPAPDRELIAELSPDILAELGIGPRQYPMITVAGILGLHGCNLWLAVQDLREMQTKQRVERIKAEHTTQKVIPVTGPGQSTMPAVSQSAVSLPAEFSAPKGPTV